MVGPAVSEEVARAWRQRQVEIDGCQDRTRLIGPLASDHTRRREAVLPCSVFVCKNTGAHEGPRCFEF